MRKGSYLVVYTSVVTGQNRVLRFHNRFFNYLMNGLQIIRRIKLASVMVCASFSFRDMHPFPPTGK